MIVLFSEKSKTLNKRNDFFIYTDVTNQFFCVRKRKRNLDQLMEKKHKLQDRDRDPSIRAAKRARMGVGHAHGSSNKWSRVPSDLLAMLCLKTSSTCQQHYQFATVCQAFVHAARKPQSWGNDFTIYVEPPEKKKLDEKGQVIPTAEFRLLDNEYEVPNVWTEETIPFFRKSLENVQIKSLYISVQPWPATVRMIQEAFNHFSFKFLETLEFQNLLEPTSLVRHIHAGKCPLLKELKINLSETNTTNPVQLEHFHAICTPSLTSLIILDNEEELVYDEFLSDQKSDNHIVYLPELKELHFESTAFTGNEQLSFLAWSSMKNLQTASFRNCVFRGTQMFDVLTGLKSFRFFTSMWESYVSLMETDLITHIQAPRISLELQDPATIEEQSFDIPSTFMQHLGNNKFVQDLEFKVFKLPRDCNAFGSLGLNKLKVYGNSSKIRELILPSSLQELQWNVNGMLRGERNNIIPALINCKSLLKLELQNMQFPEDWSALLNCTQLQEVHLKNVNFSTNKPRAFFPKSLSKLILLQYADELFLSSAILSECKITTLNVKDMTMYDFFNGFSLTPHEFKIDKLLDSILDPKRFVLPLQTLSIVYQTSQVRDMQLKLLVKDLPEFKSITELFLSYEEGQEENILNLINVLPKLQKLHLKDERTRERRRGNQIIIDGLSRNQRLLQNLTVLDLEFKKPAHSPPLTIKQYKPALLKYFTKLQVLKINER